MARLRVAPLVVKLASLALLVAAVVGAPEDEEGEDYSYEAGEPGDVGEGGEGGKGADEDARGPSSAYAEEDARGPSAVYVMEHGFLSGDAPDWLPRGTLLLSGSPGGRSGYEARLSDAKEFVTLRPELQKLMGSAAGNSRYYAIRMYSPESPRRVLQASIPAKLLADHFEDWHDILEVTVGSTGVPVGLSYRVRHTLGLALFDHTQVHLAEPSRTEGPRVPPSNRAVGGGRGGGGEEGQQADQGPQSLLRRYWWVIIILLLLLSSSMEDPSAGGKGGGGGGGGGGGRRA